MKLLNDTEKIPLEADFINGDQNRRISGPDRIFAFAEDLET